MKILYASDIHVDRAHLPAMLALASIEKADGLIVGGDIIPHGLPKTDEKGILYAQKAYLERDFIPALKEFKEKNSTHIYLDLGNDDFIASRSSLEAHDGSLFHLLHMRRHALAENLDIVGYMAVPPTPFTIKDWEKPDSMAQPYAEGGMVAMGGYVSRFGKLEKMRLDFSADDTIEKDLARLSGEIERPFIFVSHCPPYNTALDMLYNGQHIGSRSIRHFIETWSSRGCLPASLHGHIHESPEISGSRLDQIGSTVCINAGQLPGSEFQYVIFNLLEEKRGASIQLLE